MEDAELSALAVKIDQLISLVEQLRAENRQLRAGEQRWREERTQLIEQNERVRQMVEAMLARLKTLE